MKLFSVLADPDRRRALRAVVDALVLLALVALLYVITGKLSGNPDAEKEIARGCLIILALATLFYGAENVTRAFKLSGPGGFAAEFGDEPKGGTAT